MLQNTIEIANGPSREELFDGLRLFSEKRTVDFVFINNTRSLITLATSIKSIEPEDESGHYWNIKLLIKRKDLPQFKLPVEFRLLFFKKDSFIFKAHYSSKNRVGEITFPMYQHRIVIHNLAITRPLVERMMQAELGKLKIINWKFERRIDYKAYPDNSGCLYPQSDTIWLVNYIKE